MGSRSYNSLEIIGTDEQVNEVKNFLKGVPDQNGDVMCFDFSQVIPVPEELGIQNSRQVRDYLFNPKESLKHLDPASREFLKSISSDDNVEILTGRLIPVLASEDVNENNPQYQKSDDMTDYTDWCYSNWDSKYNAFDQQIVGENLINFTTINDTAQLVIHKLSEIFPTVIFIYENIRESPDDEIRIFEDGKLVRHYWIDYSGENSGNNKEILGCYSKLGSHLLEKYMVSTE